jgi:hypothetical protein
LRTSPGEGYSAPLYRYYSSTGDVFQVTTSATPRSGFSQQTLLGYLNSSPNVQLDLFDDTAHYQLVSRSTGKIVGTPQASTANGTKVVNDAGSRTNGPFFRLRSVGDGFYWLTDMESGRALDVSGASTANGGKVQVWSYAGAKQQQWRVEAVAAGYFRVVSRNSGKCLDVLGSASGTQLQQWECNGGANQQFRMIKRGQAFDNNDAAYEVIMRHSGKPMEIAGAATNDGAVAQQRSFDHGNQQRWRIRRSGSVLLVTAKHSGKLLEISGGSTSNGARAQQWGTTEASHRRWRFSVNAEGYIQLINDKSGKCLDAAGSTPNDGVEIQQWTCGAGQDQQFEIVRVE